MSEHWYPRTLLEGLQALGAVIVMTSAALAVYEYRISRADRHVDQTLKFVEAFDGERLAEAQRKIDQLTADAADAADQQVKVIASSDDDEADLDKMRDRVFIEKVMASEHRKAGSVPSHLLDITSFFNGLQVCIEQELCDSNVAHAFFDAYGQSFWRAYLPVIRYERQSQRPHFASGMERFLSSAKVGDQ